ncbi:class I SAM-dependent methyltransferase [Mycolicibacillus parakoreensis]|uniref:Methyltransferase domain-containing protein n=1 Tax=Mycolicibacillus parakoreensis TaxID=1069221 RepID=A0ABY3U3K3_9MYCO|nr:class I SAM-dependent methyltransferase [Mycolicibacillus parakoreensis]MCV7314724.1 class I SAM-dependent methyltransferase [Mycolicibacillus parakoreensis]ULN53734.1 methyltransferase domain-containing protein [Mycolicibacillus parakoreensis]
MSDDDRVRWDARYAGGDPPSSAQVGPPAVFAPYAEVFPTAGRALDLACGVGGAAVWLARRGLAVRGVDVSPVAIGQARVLAERSGVAQRCRFDVADLDDGLPDGPTVSVVLCHHFTDRRLDTAIVDRLAPGGLLAVAALSVVGANGGGRYRVAAGELSAAFASLQTIASGEGRGHAWLLGRKNDG